MYIPILPNLEVDQCYFYATLLIKSKQGPPIQKHLLNIFIAKGGAHVARGAIWPFPLRKLEGQACGERSDRKPLMNCHGGNINSRCKHPKESL